MKTNLRWVLPWCVFVIASLPCFQTFAQSVTNSWTKPTSGYWEEPYWSLGLPPEPGQSIFIGNAGWKAVAIGSSTAANYPLSLTVEAVEVYSPVDSFNTLVLNYAGIGWPLRINGALRVGTNSALVSYASGLQAANFYLSGAATFDLQSQANFGGQVAVGVDGAAGELDVLQASFNAAQLILNGQSTLNLSNGVVTSGSFSVNAQGSNGVASVNIFDGSMWVSNIVQVGLVKCCNGVLGYGNFVMSAGEFHAPGMMVVEGSLSQSGGTNDLGAITLPHNSFGSPGSGSYDLSGGTLLSSTAEIGYPGLEGVGNGVVNQSGGVHVNSAELKMWGNLRTAQQHIGGTYNLSGGLLISPSLQLYTGRFTQTGGTNRAGNIGMAEASVFDFSAGSISSSNMTISGAGAPDFYSYLQSFYTQTDGSHDVQGAFSVNSGGVARLQGGWLRASDIRVAFGSLELSGAAVTNSGTFTMVGAYRVSVNGNYPQLGKLVVTNGASVLDFGSGAATVHFRDSHDATWDSTLEVRNWSGFGNGGGTDRLYVGTSSQGLTRQQLDLVHFVNPAGMPSGTYPGVILATGEVVPGPRPTISFTRSSGGMVISWSGNYQLLTSTNVAGPYSTVSGAMGRYTNSFNEPQQFFVLRSP